MNNLFLAAKLCVWLSQIAYLINDLIGLAVSIEFGAKNWIEAGVAVFFANKSFFLSENLPIDKSIDWSI